uniref:Uncharacterized protein n=2 Tax=Physcomitrium patens TaxID=3218 RepID=A0A2K1JPR5_PHYPA|nr:hypothetical protein PHYPA_015915 [Physcomitrium patens]
MTYIFYAHSISLNLICMNQKVLLINDTYKTNKYWILFIYVVGFMAFNSSFTMVLVFMASKEVGSYWIALE